VRPQLQSPWVRDATSPVRIDGLDDEVVLVDVQAVLLQALGGHAGADHLRQAVDVQRLDRQDVLDRGAQLLRPRLGTEHAHLERRQVDARLGRRLTQPQRVRGRAGQHVGLQVGDHAYLPFGHPARHRDHGGAQGDRALVNAQAAGEQPVPIGVVHDASGGRARAGQRPRAHRRPQVQVGLGVGDERGPALRPRGSVHRHDPVLRDGEHPQRVGVPEVLLGGERQFVQLGEGDVGATLDARRAQPVRLDTPGEHQPVDEPPQPMALQRRPLVTGHRLGLRIEHRASSRPR
jgi:hypothetical protein